jgi:hypothetical protein
LAPYLGASWAEPEPSLTKDGVDRTTSGGPGLWPDRLVFAPKWSVDHFSLAMSADQRDGSSCAKYAQKGCPDMTNIETSDKGTAVTEQGAQVASEKTSVKKGAAKARKNAKSIKPKKGAGTDRGAKRRRKIATSRARGKGARILEMIGRPQGATLGEIMKATGWQAHSVRGFLSTAARKRHLKIESSKSETGGSTYRIVK